MKKLILTILFIFLSTNLFAECTIYLNNGEIYYCEGCIDFGNEVSCRAKEKLRYFDGHIMRQKTVMDVEIFNSDEILKIEGYAEDRASDFLENLEKYEYVGNLRTGIYYETSCEKAKKIPPRFAVFFNDRDDFSSYKFDRCN